VAVGLEYMLNFIRATRKQFADNDGFQTAIIDDETIIGVVGFHAVDWRNRSTSIGYWLAENRQGRGTMTEAVRALLDHAFTRWNLNRVEIRVAGGNLRSRAIPSRLGLVDEGVLREAERFGERFEDSVVYSMLAKDWP
jgi:ribosomal-protein-serine acetyltransferase